MRTHLLDQELKLNGSGIVYDKEPSNVSLVPTSGDDGEQAVRISTSGGNVVVEIGEGMLVFDPKVALEFGTEVRDVAKRCLERAKILK